LLPLPPSSLASINPEWRHLIPADLGRPGKIAFKPERENDYSQMPVCENYQQEVMKEIEREFAENCGSR